MFIILTLRNLETGHELEASLGLLFSEFQSNLAKKVKLHFKSKRKKER